MENEAEAPRIQLERELLELSRQFEREMRARGFDPAQAENIALPSALARLYAAREEIRAALEDMDLQETKEKD